MDDTSNILDLFSGDADKATSQAALLARAIRQRRAGGTLGMITGDPAMGAVGKEMTGDADKMETTLIGAGQARMHYGPQMQERQELVDARKSPGYVKALRDTLGGYGLNVDENTPPQALEKLLPIQEKLAQANAMGGLRFALRGMQQKQDPNTGEQYLLHPVTGATYHMDGRPRTAGVAGAGGGFGGGSAIPNATRAAGGGGAPSSAPTPPASTPPAPRQPAAPVASPGANGAPQTLADYQPPQVLPASKLFPVIQREAAQFRKQLNPTSTSSGAIRQQYDKVQAANVLETLMTNGAGGLENLTSQQQREAATSLAKMLGAGGGMSEGQIEHLDAPSLKRWLAEKVQFFTSQPQGTEAYGTFQNLLDTARREKTQAQASMRDAVAGEVAQFPNVVKYQPQIVAAMVKPHGLGLQHFDRSGAYIGPKIGLTPTERGPGGSGLSGADAQAKAWADANPNDPRAAKILQRLGGGR